MGTRDIAMGQANVRKEQDLCELHLRPCKLFCSNCSIGICGVCMLGVQHDLHQITNLAVVYHEKLTNVESELVRAEKRIEELRSGTNVYQRNLELLEEEESFVRQEINAIAEASKLEVSNKTNVRKEMLRAKLEFPTTSAERLVNLRHEVEHMSANELMQQYPEIEEKCSDLNCAPEDVTLQRVDDIECALIPPYQFKRIVYQGLLETTIFFSRVCMLKSTHDVEWNLTITKTSEIKIKATPSDPQLLAFRHVLIVTIPHQDFTKQIQRKFVLDDQHSTFDVVQMSHITEEGFCSDNGDLVMMIGIRPLNTLVEKEILAHQYEQQKDTVEKLSRQLHSITDKYDYNHLTMCFTPKLSDLQARKLLYSFRVRDDEDRQWCMVLKFDDDAVNPSIQLFSGSAISCNFFVELKHKNPAKTVVRTGKCERDKWGLRSEWGWDDSFIAWDTLSNDTGFHPDGCLHFRFGVLPSPNSCAQSSCAANA